MYGGTRRAGSRRGSGGDESLFAMFRAPEGQRRDETSQAMVMVVINATTKHTTVLGWWMNRGSVAAVVVGRACGRNQCLNTRATHSLK